MHKSDCPNVRLGRENPENTDRWVEAYWEERKSGSVDLYEAQISIYVFDRMGIIADISVALSDMKVQLLQINTSKYGSDGAIVNLKISCKNVDHYHSIVSKLKSIEGVNDITRGYAQ